MLLTSRTGSPISLRAIVSLVGLLALIVPARALAESLSVTPLAPSESLAFARYIASIQERDPFTESGPVLVQIDASLPGLYKKSCLLALRQTGESERREWFVLDIEGDATVTQEVIASYLAVQDRVEDLPLSSVEVTPANYRFRYMGAVGTGATSTYLFRITPKKNRPGLLRGQIWLDLETGIAVLEAGQYVKTPLHSVRRMEVVRDTKLLNGHPLVRVTHAAIETQRLGRGELTITEYRLQGEEEKTSKPTGALRGPLTAVTH
jgi:hypothetical protein